MPCCHVTVARTFSSDGDAVYYRTSRFVDDVMFSNYGMAHRVRPEAGLLTVSNASGGEVC